MKTVLIIAAIIVMSIAAFILPAALGILIGIALIKDSLVVLEDDF